MAGRRLARSMIAVYVAALGAFSAGAGLAATLGVSSRQLTVYTYASSIAPTTCTLTAAVADSYVDSVSSATNYGAVTNLDVRSWATGNRRAFVRFNVSTCSIPANALITSANLKLFMYSAPSANRTYAVHAVSASWTEPGITWANQPAVAASATATTSTGTTSNVTLGWTVTADVQAFVDGTTNNGWRIRDQTESSTTSRLGQFRSREYGGGQAPTLDVTYYP
jgi:hypothetical protein